MANRSLLLCLASVILLAAGCGSPGSGVADLASAEAPPAAVAPTLAAKELVRWRKGDPTVPPGVALPQSGVMVALRRWGETNLAVLDTDNAKIVSLATRETGSLVMAQGGGRLAYLVREGPSPAKNHVEIFDWRGSNRLIVEPANDEAILGFTLDAEGKKLSYAAMNLRASRSTQVTWRIGLLDLERLGARVVVDSTSEKIRDEGVPVPFAWSVRTGRLYLQGWSPFRGMIRQSVWAMSPERGEAAKIIPAPDYVGTPRLSPDGTRLAYLSTEIGSLPAEFVAAPGAPPGNILSVIDLATGEGESWARGGKSAFGAFAWSARGEEIFAAEQAWVNGRFRDVEVRRIGKGAAASVAKVDSSPSMKVVTNLLECRERNLYWVEKERAAAKLYVNRGETAQLLFELADGAIELLGCLNR